MTAMLSRCLVHTLFLILFCCSGAWGQESEDLRDLRVGMSISAIAPDEYIDLRCAGTSSQTIGGWSDFRSVRKLRPAYIP